MRTESTARGGTEPNGAVPDQPTSTGSTAAHPTAEGSSAPAFGEGSETGRLPATLLWALALCVGCAALATVIFGFTRGDRLSTPLAREDNFFYASLIKSMDEGGWYHPTDALGAPHGQELLDLPLGDNRLHLLTFKAMTLLWSDPIVVLNVYVVLAFGLIAGVTYLCLRSVGVEHGPAVVAAVLFAFLPYHFGRAPYHPFLQAYYEVPLVLPLVKWALGGRLLRRRRLELALVGALAAVVASTGVYYAAMLAILLLAAALVDGLRTQRWASILRGAGVVAVIGVVLLANFAPNLLYQRREGTNSELAQRSSWEAETLGLRPSLLVLPPPQHRVKAMADLGKRAQDVPSPGEGPVSLGVVGALGLVLLLGFSLASIVRTGMRGGTAAFLGVLTLVAFLVGTKGGLSYAAALFGAEQLRTWSRIAVFVGLFALAFLALHVPLIRARFGPRLTTGMLAAVLIVGLADQVPADPTPERAGYATEVTADRAFTRGLEQALPENAMVFNLPVTRFPEEPPPGTASGYDDLRFHILGTGKLRYSYGNLRGRQDEWRERWAGVSTTATVVAAAAAGFSAVVVDRYGLHPNARAAEADVSHLLGPPKADNSAWKRYAWYDLRPLRRRIEQAHPGQIDEITRAVADPPALRWKGGGQAYRRVFPVGRDLQPLARAEVTSSAPRPVRLDGLLRVPEGGEARVTMDGQEVARLPAGENKLAIPVTLTRRQSELRIELMDVFAQRRLEGRVIVAQGLFLVDPAADVVNDLARTWGRAGS